MALEVVTGGKNNKTEKNDQEYVHNKRTRDGTCVLFSVLPSFVLIDDKHIFFMCYYKDQITHTKNEELRMKQWCLYLHSSFPFFQDYAIKAEIIYSYYHLSSEDQNKKNVQLDWQETDNVDAGRGW